MEKIRPYEPNLVKAAWNIFGKSYQYSQKYNDYKEKKKKLKKEAEKEVEGQMSIFDLPEVTP